MTINQLCCAGATLVLVAICLLIIIWCLCIAARRADENANRIGGSGSNEPAP